VVGSRRLTHHNGPMQVFTDTNAGSRVVWIADLLPHEAAPDIGALMERGLDVMKKTLG